MKKLLLALIDIYPPGVYYSIWSIPPGGIYESMSTLLRTP